MIIEDAANKLDAMPNDRLVAALNALDIYETETSAWLDENDDDDAYDEFCIKLTSELLEEYGISVDDFDFIMEVSCGDWKAVIEIMKVEENKCNVFNIFRRHG